MKDAKSEAQKEIEEYRNQKEAEFKKFEAEVRRSPESTPTGLGSTLDTAEYFTAG